MALQNKIAQIIQAFKENLTGYVGVIGSDHAYIHQGKAFTALINTGAISTAYEIGFTTPSVASGKFIHWRPLGIDSSAAFVQADLYEGDSYTAGTLVTPINRNRAGYSSTTSTMQDFKDDTTATPAGTLIQHTGIGTAGNAVSQSGGGSSAGQEIVLKANTDHVIQLTPSAETTVILTLFWYEEDGYNGA
jgi:hypothetical protein